MPANPGSVCHLEMQVDDIARAKSFYGAVFGWEFHDMGATYAIGNMGSGCSIGIDQVADVPADGPHLPYVEVGGINETLQTVQAAGGAVEEGATEIAGGLGFYAVIRDPAGNRLGIHKSHS